MARGRLIALEGGEGVGKSTQAARLTAHLSAIGVEVVSTREPGGTPGAEAIRKLLLHQVPSGGWTVEAEALLFAAARADHVARLIRPALARDAWVVCDRFVGSSLAYQGAAGGLGSEAILRLHEIGSGGMTPDATLVLTIPIDQASERVSSRGGSTDAIGDRDAAYHALVDGSFEEMIDAGLAQVVDGSGSPDAVARRVLEALAGLLPSDAARTCHPVGTGSLSADRTP